MNINYSVWPLGNGQFGGRQDWPQISIVTPNYNGAEFLPAAIESVLKQNYPNLQYAVLDGDSSDGSQQVIERYADRLHYWHSRRDGGQYEAINEGFTRTSGEVCGWLNSDDQHFPWTLHTVGAIFRDFPEIQWITGIPATLQQGIVQSMMTPQKGYCRLLIEAGCHGGGLLPLIQQESSFWRRSLWDRTTGLDPAYPLAADFHLWRQFAAHAELVTCHFLLGSFHLTGTNRSVRHRQEYQGDITHSLESSPAEQKQLRRRVSRYRKMARYPGVRKVCRQLSGLSALRCPVLILNPAEDKFTLREIEPGL